MKKTARVLSLILCMAMVFSFVACNQKTESQKFDEFCKQEYIEYVTGDTLTLHYSVKDPKAMGITEKEPTFGNFNLEEIKKEIANIETEIKKLSEFKRSELSKQQQLTYDIIMESLKTEQKAKGFEYYSSNFTPIGGFQSNIQTNFVEYTFYNKQDVSNYIALLNQFDSYVNKLLDFEKERAEKGFGLRDDILDKSIEQCKEFIAPQENCLITVFNEKVVDVKDLTDAEKTEFKEANKKAVNEKIVPTYQSIIKELTNLKGKCKNQDGLVKFENGKAYYEYLVEKKVGSEKTVAEIAKAIDTDLLSQITVLQKLIQADASVLMSFDKAKVNITDPKAMIDDLKGKISKGYPEYPDVNLNIKPIYKSIENDNILGYCLVPPVDDQSNNSIRINETASKDNALGLYNLMAHEGYPGHLYQMTYFNATKPDHIRSALDFIGYSEGWATYVERESFEFAQLGGEALTTLMQINDALDLGFACRIDIGVNYEGWDVAKVNEYLTGFGLGSEEMALSLYQTVIGDPAAFLPYYVGCLEVIELENYTKDELGDKFDIKEFRKAFLDCGPAPFGIVKQEVQKYIDSKKK